MEKKQREEELTKKADLSLEEGKICVKNKKFEEAKGYYEEAIDIFKKLGWSQQVEILQKELRNIDKYKEEHEKRLEDHIAKRKEKEEAFEQRVDQVLAEKKKKEDDRLARLRALSPELQQNLEKAKMLIERAEREVQMGKLQRALGRYEYILELYNTIPNDKMDLSSDISEIEVMISEIKLKL